MAWITPRNWIFGEKVTAAFMNSIRDNLNELFKYTQKGDILVSLDSNNVAKKSVGSDASVLTANSGDSTGIAWTVQPVGINVILGDGVTYLTSGSSPKGYLQMPASFTITGVDLVSDVSSASAVVSIWDKSTFPPTSSDSIVSATPPTLAGSNHYSDSTLTGWNKNITAGDWMGFTVTSASACRQVTLSIRGNKTL